VVPTTTKASTTNTSLVASTISTIYTIDSTIGVYDTSANNFNSRHHLQPIRTSATLAI